MMEGPQIEKQAWRYTDETKKALTTCAFDDENVAQMLIGFRYNNVEIRREDFPSIAAMNYHIDKIESMLLKAFNQGRNYQAAMIQRAMNPNARPTH